MSTQHKFFELEQGFDTGLWRIYGRKLYETQEVMQWETGDWLLEAEEFGGWEEATLKKEALKIFSKRSWATLKNYKSVARLVPASRRRDGISFSMHRLVSPFSPADQTRLLDKVVSDAERGQEWSVEDMTGFIGSEQDRGVLPPTKKPELVQPEDQYKLLKVRLTRAQCGFLKAIAPQSWSGNTAAQIIQEYIGVNIEKLMERAVQCDERWAKVPRTALVPLGGNWDRTDTPNPLPRIQPDHEFEARLEARKASLARLLEKSAAECKAAGERGDAVNAAEEEARKAAGRPNRLELGRYYERLAKLRRDLHAFDQQAPKLLTVYIERTLEVGIVPGRRYYRDFSKVTCHLWEATLAKLEGTGGADALVQFLKSAADPVSK